MVRNVQKLLFQDNTGKYVVAQPPNMLVYIMIAGSIGASLSKGAGKHRFELLFFGATFAWSYLEIRFGESGVRRLMGVIVIIGLFVSWLT